MSTARRGQRARWADLCSVFAPAAAMSGLLGFGVVDVGLGAAASAILIMGGIATLVGSEIGIATSEHHPADDEHREALSDTAGSDRRSGRP